MNVDAELEQRLQRQIDDAGAAEELINTLALLTESERKALFAVTDGRFGPNWRIAYLATAPNAREVARLFGGSRPRADMLRVLRQRSPSWLRDLAHALDARQQRDENGYLLLRELVRAGLAEQTSVASSRGLASALLPPSAWQDDDPDPPETSSVLAALRHDPYPLEHELWSMLASVGAGRGLELNDSLLEHRYRQDRPDAPPLLSRRTWRHALVTLATEGTIDRGRLLDAVQAAFLADWTHHDQTWYFRLHDELQPSDDELADRQPGYANAAASGSIQASRRSVEILRRLLAVDRADAKVLLEVAPAVLSRPDKAPVRAFLALLEAGAQRWPHQAAELGGVLGVALEHPAADVQRKARALIDRLLGVRAGQVESASPLSVFVEAPPPTPGPLAPAERVRPVADPDELRALFAQLIEEVADPVAVERLLEGVLRFTGERPPDGAEVLLRRCRRLAQTYQGDAREEVRPHIVNLAFAWLTGRAFALLWPERINGVFRSLDSRQPRRHPDQEHWSLGDVVVRRHLDVTDRVRTGGGVLVAFPSHADGSITADDLLARLAKVGDDHPPIDLAVAALRLAPGKRAAVRSAAEAALIRPYLDLIEGFAPGWVPVVGQARGRWHHSLLDGTALSWRDRNAGSVTADPLAAILRRADPLATLSKEASDGHFVHRFEQMTGLWPLLLPHHRELLAAHSHPRFNRGLTKTRAGTTPVLAGLSRGPGAAGPVTASALILGLCAELPTDRIAAVDAVLDLSRTGRLHGAQLATQARLALEAGIVVLARLGDSLRECATADPTAAFVVLDALVDVLPALPGRREAHRLVELTADLAVAAGRPVPLPDEFIALARGRRATLLAEACRRIDQANRPAGVPR